MISFQVNLLNTISLLFLTAGIFEWNVITSHPSRVVTPKEYQKIRTIGDNSTNHIRAENNNCGLKNTFLASENGFLHPLTQTKRFLRIIFYKENLSHRQFYLRI
jgi:hypothetical protein